MAVYTEVSDEDLKTLATAYDFGEIISCKGISEGIENSNYLLQTSQDSFILTLYERRVNPNDLPFFMSLKDHFAKGFRSKKLEPAEILKKKPRKKCEVFLRSFFRDSY